MSLVAWYKLDGNAEDSSGNGYHGTNNGVTWVSGKIDGAGSFDGNNDFLQVNENINNLISASGFTIGVWVKAYELNYGVHVCANAGDWFLIDCGRSGTFRVGWNNENGNWNSKEVSVDLNRWYHRIVVYDGTTLTHYLDGVKDFSIDTSLFGFGDHTPYFGKRYNNTYGFNGLIDDVRIYDHALSIKEITDLAKAKVLHYKLNDPEKVLDYSGYENHGINHEATFTEDSKIGIGSYRFDGAGQNVATSKTLDYRQDFTVCTWLKRNERDNWVRAVDMSSQDYPGLVGIHSNNQGFFGYRQKDNSTIATYYNIDNYADVFDWFHVAIVKKDVGGQWPYVYAYVNGFLSYSRELVEIDEEKSGLITLGGDGTRSWNGLIGETKVFATALTHEQIKEIYNTRIILDNDGNLYLSDVFSVDSKTFTSSTTFTVPENVTTMEVLVVAGGGGGGGRHAAGGGAGGVVYRPEFQVTPGEEILINIGKGGTGGASNVEGENGENSSFGTITAIGGGGGGTWSGRRSGADGGSGGGSSSGTTTQGQGVEGQGHRGGLGYTTSGSPYNHGGGGGAGEPGHDGTSTSNGKGGDGIYFGDIFGGSYGQGHWLAGGGGGGGHNPAAEERGYGGYGGGGHGAEPDLSNQPGGDATPNTGGGGGGAGTTSSGSGKGGDGGSGIVIIQY